ncbi:hypothetical protein GCM10009087_30100 [Sphingomonas oligophenolica]
MGVGATRLRRIDFWANPHDWRFHPTGGAAASRTLAAIWIPDSIPSPAITWCRPGHSNTEIARVPALTPRTVDGYLTGAWRLFEVHCRPELVVRIILAGGIGLYELRSRQPE